MRYGVLLACAIAWAAPAEADTVLTARGAIQALPNADFIDWSSVGPESTLPPNPFMVVSNGGKPATVSGAGTFDIAVQGSRWGGNFSPGDFVLINPSTPGVFPVSIDFGSYPLTAIGTQIQLNNPPFAAFTAKVEIFDSSGSLGSETAVGFTDRAGNGSAVFIGLISTVPFTRVEFSVIAGSRMDLSNFGINRVDFAPVPEPALSLLVLVVILWVVYRQRPQLR